MVAAGAGVGVSVAFGAPIGGVLFAYEVSKANTFWTFGIAWKTFISTSCANLTLTILESIKNGDYLQVTNSGLLKFANINGNFYDLGDIAIFAIIGVFAAIIGSTYIYLNSSYAQYRKANFKQKWQKLVEAIIWAFVGATVVFWLPSAFGCNTPTSDIPESVIQRYDCFNPDDENPLASLLYATEGDTLRFFLTRIGSDQVFNIGVSICFFAIWFLFCAAQYGIAVPAGLFFPGLLIGGSLG